MVQTILESWAEYMYLHILWQQKKRAKLNFERILSHTLFSPMADARIEELKTLLPRCLLPDWVRLGRRLARLLRDRHHPGQRDALLERLWQQVKASVALR